MMQILRIKRQKNRESKPYWQAFQVNPPPRATVAWAIRELNACTPLVDIDAQSAEPIGWSCACMQKTCGACAMVIDGRPMLACACFLDDYPPEKEIRLEPLSKFPVICDLAVDKTQLEENMQLVKAWLADDAKNTMPNSDLIYRISQCMMCGCCYEACPNCLPNSDFVGPPSIYAAFRAMVQDSDIPHAKEIKAAVRRLGKSLCSKSLACNRVCPANISISNVLIQL